MSAAAKFFLEPKLLYALLLLIPFILIYFIRPKPRHEVIPTLMFLFKDMGLNKKTTFLRRILHDLLFLLQLLILVLLLTALAKPYINVTKESLFKNTVIVLDASASMKADYESRTRFDEAVSIAKKNLGMVNTLIVVKKTPNVVLVDKPAGEVKEYLKSLKSSDSPTNLYDAVIAAGSYAKGDSRVVVISDFIDTETDSSLSTAKKTLESQGIKVDFIRVFKPVRNVGIVDLKIEDKKTTAVIRNYADEEAVVKLKVNSLEETINVPPASQELFSFSTPPGVAKLELELQGEKDGFLTDNTAFISTTGDAKRKVLLITNNPSPKKTFLFNVFDVMKNTEITVAVPPKIPDLENYDVFIFKDINPSLILPGTYKGVINEVESQGKALVIAAQPDLLGIDYQGLLPFGVMNITKTSSPLNILPTSTESLSSDLSFGITKKYFKLKPVEGKSFVTIAATEDKNPVITFMRQGNGKHFYYGILDEDSEAGSTFPKSPDYFVFWKRLIDLATDTPSLSELNMKTGSIINLKEEQLVNTPEGRIRTDKLMLDNIGLYTLKDRAIAINLLNHAESDINNQGSIDEKGFAQPSERFKEKVPYELTDYFIIIALILLLFEFLYIKLRGDL